MFGQGKVGFHNIDLTDSFDR